jgi:hypothetical protein
MIRGPPLGGKQVYLQPLPTNRYEMHGVVVSAAIEYRPARDDITSKKNMGAMDFLISDYKMGLHWMQRDRFSKEWDKLDSSCLQQEVYIDLLCSRMSGVHTSSIILSLKILGRILPLGD